MTITETIARLEELREVIGHDVDVCFRIEKLSNSLVTVYDPLQLQVQNVVAVEMTDSTYYVSLMNGNTTQIVTVF